jgi:hypothetical protein
MIRYGNLTDLVDYCFTDCPELLKKAILYYPI